MKSTRWTFRFLIPRAPAASCLLVWLLLAAGLTPVAQLRTPPASAHDPNPADLDNKGAVFAPSVALGADGTNLIAYVNGFNELRLARCADSACTSAELRTLARRANFFDSTSIAVGADGIPVIAFSNVDQRLVVVRCTNAKCSGARSSVINDETYPYISHPRVAIGGDGYPLIVAVGGPTPTGSHLAVWHCQDASCRKWITNKIVEDPGNAKYDISVNPKVSTLNPNRSLIAYLRQDVASRGELVVVNCQDLSCAERSQAILDSFPIVFSLQGEVSIQRGADALGIIAYSNGELGTLKVAKCVLASCVQAVVSLLSTEAASPVSLSIGGDGNGLIAYVDIGPPEGGDADDVTQVLHCDDPSCTSAKKGAALSPTHYDFAIGTTKEGKGLLAFANAVEPRILRAAHCEEADCSTPF